MATQTYPAGVCRFCGGTDDAPSKLTDGSEAAWMDARRNVCMAPGCQARLAMEPKIKRDRMRHDVADLLRRRDAAVRPISERMKQRKQQQKLRALARHKGGR